MNDDKNESCRRNRRVRRWSSHIDDGAGVTGSDAESQPQAFCAKATECMNQSLSGMAAQPGSAYRGGGHRMYSIE